jgi:hypothetical protein
MPSIPSVPLMSERPSFSVSTTGSIPAASSASPAGTGAPAGSVPRRTWPSPIRVSAQWASGLRSPEQPSEPYSCTTGVMPALRIAA